MPIPTTNKRCLFLQITLVLAFSATSLGSPGLLGRIHQRSVE